MCLRRRAWAPTSVTNEVVVGGDTAKGQCRGARVVPAVGAVQRRGARCRTAFMRRVAGTGGTPIPVNDHPLVRFESVGSPAAVPLVLPPS